MASMFGGFGGGFGSSFDFMGQVVQGNPGPAGPGGGFGGFPGIFPGAGVSNSGWAGFGTFGKVGPCTPEDVRKGSCVMGPSMNFLGKHH